jgi:WD40 repeat protein
VEAVACTTLNGRTVAVTAGWDGTVRVWDLSTGQQVGDPLTGHWGEVEAVACTTLNGRTVAVTTGDDGTVRVWDLTALRAVAVLDQPGPVSAVAATSRHVVVGVGWDVVTYALSALNGALE